MRLADDPEDLLDDGAPHGLMPLAVPSSPDALIRSRTGPWHPSSRHKIHIKKTQEPTKGAQVIQAAERTRRDSTWARRQKVGLDGFTVGSANVVLLLSPATFDAQFAVGRGRIEEEERGRREKELLSLSPFVYGLCPPQ